MKFVTLMSLLGLVFSSPSFAAEKGFVVMIPGASSSGTETYIKNVPMLFANNYFGKYHDLLTDSGIDNFVCPETSDDDQRSIEEREEECVTQILNQEKTRGNSCLPGATRDVVIMGHSMGGLVARELAQDPRVSSCIKTVLQVSTPNKGAVIADFSISHAASDDKSFDFYGALVKFIGFTTDNLRYLEELRADRSSYTLEEQSRIFHAQDIPDNQAVEYYSVSTSFSQDPLRSLDPVSLMRSITSDELKLLKLDQTSYGDLNDGVVPEYSQIHGNYLGHLEINHMESACMDIASATAGCQQAADYLIPLLQEKVVLKAASQN